jgi:prepilin signal peptidase PulO-like enzyme (type II secretory pathway)
LQLLVTIWIAVVGLCVGSFLNVVIARMPHAELDEPEAEGFWPKVRAALRFSGHAYSSLWTPKHSKCPKCGRYKFPQELSGEHIRGGLICNDCFMSGGTDAEH